MTSSLLSTKVRIPPTAHRLVPRSRLTDLLELNVPVHKVTFVSAPAGYGKTTLLAEWAQRSSLPVAWLTLEPDDNELERFLRYLFAAWAAVDPDIRDSPPGVLLSGMMPDTGAVLSGLVNHATDSTVDMVLIIDDCHSIDDHDIIEALGYLLEHLPPTVRIVLAGRAEPALPVARYRARQEAFDIGSDDLKLTVDECRGLLIDTMGLDMTDDAIAGLQNQLEGWAAGLQLASLTLRERSGPLPDITVTGRHRFIADFLREEILTALPEETRRFLMQTCIAERLCGSLCDAITGRVDGQERLENLERQHVFTTALDDDREWFRYHGLFADLLRQELARQPADETTALHQRAAIWYLHQKMPDPAFDHALAAEDLPLVMEVLVRYGLVKLFTGQVRAVHGWLTAIPDEWYDREPEIGLLRVAWLMFTGQFEDAIGTLDAIENTVSTAEDANQRALGRVSAIRCFIACEANMIEQAERFAEAALDRLPPNDDEFRGGVWGALGDVYRQNGRWSDAHRNYLRALPHNNNPAGYVQSVGAYGALADLEYRQGHLHRATDYWHNALAVIKDERMWGSYPLPVIGWIYIRLGEILYEWNALAACRDACEQGRGPATLGGDPRTVIAAGILAARLELAGNDIDAAAEHLESIRPTVTEAQFTDWSSEFERWQVELWLAQGKLRTAVTWSDEALARDPANLADREPVLLAIARVHMVKGDAVSVERVLSLLRPLLETANASGRIGLEVTALALQSMACWQLGNRTDALTSIEHALRLAEPEGYTRTFADLGLPMARVLQEARHRKVMPEYVDRLLEGFGQGELAQLPTDSRLPEPLSDRELEVLRRIAIGLTNREIADALFISPETVKKHTGSIYGKLGVGSRTEAVARSRELEMLN